MGAEKRWIVLGTDGRHVTLGRHSDPTADELANVESSLRAQGLSGWLAVTSGTYYGPGQIEVVQVRPLADPPADAWSAAVEAFRDRRSTMNKSA